jgi:DNA-binding winged helix-turn-helix (wHTH) protein
MTGSSGPHWYRFGAFELDARSGELWRDGVRIRLQERPFQALLVLIEHAGTLVTRDELLRRLLPGETFVDFEHGVNSIMARLREVLGDSAANPVFIQTLPRHGYRFVAPVERTAPHVDPEPESVLTAPAAPGSRSGISLRFNGFACVTRITDTNCVRPRKVVRSLAGDRTRGGGVDGRGLPFSVHCEGESAAV